MNLDPPDQFDPSEALSLFAEPAQRTLWPERSDVLLLADHLPSHRELCRVILHDRQVHRPARSSVITHAGAGLSSSSRPTCSWIDVSPTRVKLWTASADDADALRNRYLVHDGDASDAKAWEGLLKEIGRVEGFGVAMHHADTLATHVDRMARGADRGARTRGGFDAPVLTLDTWD